MIRFLVALILAIGAILWVKEVMAHQAPLGWAYPYLCCHNQDCRPVSAERIEERPEGYVIAGTGEVIPYTDSRIKESPDGLYHWCSVAGAEDSRTLCLFVPPRAY